MTISPETLRTEREESANVAYQVFIKHIQEDKEGVFCFFEGKDAPYYFLRIKNHCQSGQSIHSIKCKGKKMVLKAFDLISNHKEYNKYLKAFFVDKDYDENLKDNYSDNIYCTPCYSIENLYISSSCLSEILKHEIGFDEVSDDYKASYKLYNKLLSDFCAAVLLFNAWYCCLKDRKRLHGENTGISLEDKFPRGYLKYENSEVIQQYDINKIIQDFVNANKVSPEELDAKIHEFNNTNKEYTFRGKYYIEHLNKFLNILITDSNTEKKIVTTRINTNVQTNQIISQFSQYANTPECLIKYLSILQNLPINC